MGVIFGGRSTEHKISLLSAKNIIAALDRKKYEIIPIGIDKGGVFYYFSPKSDFIVNADDPKRISLGKRGQPVTFSFGRRHELIGIINKDLKIKLDVVFPILHGLYGEDGTLQGLLRMADLPFVGVNTLGSAVCMDKDVAKRLLRDAKYEVADFICVGSSKKYNVNFTSIAKKLGLPFFLKPANAGSSVGVHKIESKKGFIAAERDAFQYDNKIIFEKMIVGAEIECSVLGNEKVIASRPGRVIPRRDFYSYEAKYLDEDGAGFEIPAKLPAASINKIRNIAIGVYKVLGCEGMARVDGFLTKGNGFIVNEVNTVPGFTAISMYPKLWEKTGIRYSTLLDKLIKLALLRYNRDKKLRTSYPK